MDIYGITLHDNEPSFRRSHGISFACKKAFGGIILSYGPESHEYGLFSVNSKDTLPANYYIKSNKSAANITKT